MGLEYDFFFARSYINYVGKVERRHCCWKVVLDCLGRDLDKLKELL
jgi:hypothetical protein